MMPKEELNRKYPTVFERCAYLEGLSDGMDIGREIIEKAEKEQARINLMEHELIEDASKDIFHKKEAVVSFLPEKPGF